MGAPQYEQAGADVSGSGSPGTIPVWSTGTTLTDSLLLQETLAVYTPSFDTASTFAFGVKDATTNVSFGKRGSLRIQASSAIAGANAMGGGDLTLKAGDNYAGSATGTDGNVILRAGYNLLSTPFSLGSIQFVTGNAEAMRITAPLGNVGIGTASPTGRLHVVGGTAASGNGTPLTLIAQSGQASGNTNGGNIVLTPGSPNGSGTPGLVDLSGPSGTGLKLPATPGNADTQTLDCYQEGTWAPTLAGFGGTNPTVTATLTQVGRLVTLTVQMQSTGGAQYSGTLGTTTLTVPAGMTPNIPACTNLVNGAVQNLGNVAAYNDGLIYLPTFALTTAFTFFVVTYRV